MRLFDKALTMLNNSAIRADLRQRAEAGEVSVLSCDDIARHYWESATEQWTPDRYPYALPPWKTFFLEWNEPTQQRIGKGPLLPAPRGHTQSGLYGNCITDSRVIRAIVADAKHMQARNNFQRFGHTGQFGDMDRTAALFVAYPIMVIRGVVACLKLKSMAYLDAEGTVINNFVRGDILDELPDDQSSGELISLVGSLSHIAFLAFTFANCSNVKIEDATNELQPDAKIRRRLKIPEVKRYTLNIAGHVARPSRDYNEGQQGVMPFHLCRGHFATYTADKPMFGNPKLVGRYWHPPHMKGKKENGEIVKDYAIQG